MNARFLKAIEDGNMTAVRFFLSNELLLDPRGASFLEMKAYAESHCPGLYDISDELDYPVDEKAWNKDYLYRIKDDLERHFTKERLSLYEKVSKVVLKDKADYLDNQENTSGEEKEPVLIQKTRVVKTSLKPFWGLLIVGSLAVLLGVLTKEIVLCIIGCLVCALDAIVLLIKSSKR